MSIAAESIYFWRKFQGGNYTTLDLSACRIIDLSLQGQFQIVDELRSLYIEMDNYSKFTIPDLESNLLRQLLRIFDLPSYDLMFLKIGCTAQVKFSDNFNVLSDKLLSDFNSSKRDYVKLLQIIEQYLFSDNKKWVNAISFNNTHPKKSLLLKNYFVVNDIYSSICKALDINKGNFQERKIEIAERNNIYDVEMYAEMVKTVYIQSLFNFYFDKSGNKSKSLRFAGALLTIFQIPLNNRNLYVENNENIDDLLKSVDTKNLLHYIKRPKGFLV